MKTFSKFISYFLPGIFLIGLNIGTGSVASMAKAGANFGMELVWTILLSCLISGFLIYQFGKYTSVTGETFVYAIKTHVSKYLALFFVGSAFIIGASCIMGVMGIVSEVLFEASAIWFETPVSAVAWTAILVFFVALILWQGNTTQIEKVMAVIVALMGLSFILNMIITFPSVSEIFSGLVPSIPDQTPGKDNPSLVTASMVGTTVSSMMLIMRSITVKERNWNAGDLGHQVKDTLVTIFMFFLLNFAIMASSAGSLFPAGITISSGSEMIHMLEPLAGKAAVIVFVIGLVSAGISSQFPNILFFPWMIFDFKNARVDPRKHWYKILIVIFLGFNFVVPVTGARPIYIMLVSQAILAIILPVSVASIFYLSTRQKIMGKWVIGMRYKILYVFVLLITLVLSGISFYGILT